MKKILTSLLIASFLLTQTAFAPAVALALPDRPDRPDRTQTTTQPDKPDLTDKADEPDNAKPEPTPAPTQSPSPSPTASPTPEVQGAQATSSPTATPKSDPKDVQDAPKAPEAPEVKTDDSDSDSGNVSKDGQTGETVIETGDADAGGAVSNLGNTNIAVEDESLGGTSVAIENSGNGSDSENTGTVAIEDKSDTTQDNNADLDNKLEVDANTGKNTADNNVGDSTIKTGEANATGTIVNSVNTNIAGAMVSEFNVAEDHVGDLVLDYEASCIANCGAIGGVDISNKNNGSESNNTSEVELVSNDATFQNNDAAVENELILEANTGENSTSRNTGGDNKIETGDANVSGTVMNFLNNNFAGNVVYGVVNIFDDMVGDIIVPEKYASAYQEIGSVDLSNIGNGSGSQNTADANITSTDTYAQFNEADIVNNLIIDANTGGNDVSRNTGGNNSVETGDVEVDAQVLNIANNNVVGGDWWIVLVNEAGNWVGKIFAPAGSTVGNNYAAAGGSSQVKPNGDITISNAGNGADSKNTGVVNQETNNTTEQTNTAKIENDIKLTANTGKNSANNNTGGSSEIKTGDANIQFNLVNFVNNNFAGGNVFLTVVNVFGSWTGNFFTPGQKKDDTNSTDKALGGADIDTNNNSSSNNDSNNSSNNDNSNSSDSNNNESSTSTEQSQTPTVLASTSTGSYTKYNAGKVAQLGSGVNDEKSIIPEANAASQAPEESKRRINLAYLVFALPLILGLAVVRRFMRA